ncbi:MAG: hypothetical protein ACR2KJ_02125 [Jatrophihabitans sp.]
MAVAFRAALVLLVAAATGLTGCTSVVTGTATQARCTQIAIADPWITFQPALRDHDSLTVGGRGWISGVTRVADVSTDGTPNAVELAEGSVAAETRCGVVVSRVSWVEVHAIRAGSVTLTSKGTSVAVLHVTVRAH